MFHLLKFLVMLPETHVGDHVKCATFLSDFNQNCNVSTIFSETPQYEILWKSVQQFSMYVLCIYGSSKDAVDTSDYRHSVEW
jgi:hypothetical protein